MTVGNIYKGGANEDPGKWLSFDDADKLLGFCLTISILLSSQLMDALRAELKISVVRTSWQYAKKRS